MRGWTLHIALCIPARDECTSLPDLFAAIDNLRLESSEHVTLCLLLDGCSDGSLAVAERCAGQSAHSVVIGLAERGPSNAGRARGLALDMGVRAIDAADGLLLTTDADSIPSPDWIKTMSDGLTSADLVAGIVRRTGNRVCPLHDRLERYLDELFALRRALDPVPWEAAITHHHASGANIGMRPEVFHGLGGLLPLTSGEDARLLDDASRAGFRVRRDAACVVSTSDRRSGRATAGFAHALDWLDGVAAAEVPVAHPDDAAWQYRRQAVARAGYRSDRLVEVAAALALRPDHVMGVASDCPNAEAFAMRIVPTPPGGMREVSLPQAEAVLSALRGRAAA